MKKKLHFINLVFLLWVTICLTGCISIKRARRLVASGDKITAIEILAKRLSNKSNEAESVELFVSIYPDIVEELYTKETVLQYRNDFAAKYNTSEIDAIKKCSEQVSQKKNLLNHPDISLVVKRSNNLINNLNDLIRIQRAVLAMPNVIGDEKTGRFEVKKYKENFSAMKTTARNELGEFYYNIADAFYPGVNVDDRIWLIDVYKKGDSYSGYGNTSSTKCAELCYLNGRDYEHSGTIDGYKTAISWYKNAGSWVINYKDTGSKIQALSYEIAIKLAATAKTKSDYKQVISYFESAGNYKDAKTQIVVMKYYLAYLYREDHTKSSYEEAGRLFEQAGNYRRAPLETSLYQFYKKLASLKRNDSYESNKLSSGSYKPFTVSRNLVPYENDKATLSVSSSSSIIETFVPSMEKVIYPGSIINGESIADQSFTRFTSGSRNPVNFSVSSAGRTLANSTISDPANPDASVKQVRTLAARNVESLSLDCAYEFYTIYSPEDLAITTGIGAGRDKISYSIDFSNWNPEKSYTLIKVTQKYYSAAMPAPVLPVDFFAVDKNVVTASALKTVTPYYVSSVDYGRKAYFVVCSDLTSEEIISDFTACRPRDSKNKGATGMAVNPEISSKWASNGTSVSAITVSEKIYAVNDLAGMYNWIKKGTSMAVEVSEIVPISFVLRNLYSNEYAVISQSQKVNVKIHQPEPVNETKTESSSEVTAPTQNQPEVVPQYDGEFTPGQTETTQTPATETSDKPATTPSTPAGEPVSTPVVPPATEKTTKVNGVEIPVSAYNGNTSLIFVGKEGYYTCSQFSIEQGSGVITWYYDIPESDIQNCVASWSDSEYNSVTINGKQMIKNKTVYSFRDVRNNTISIDFVNSSGEHIHNLLVVKS